MQKLKQESNTKPSGMSHQDWLRQKNAANRIKKKLEVQLRRAETENLLKQEQINEENLIETQTAVEKWMKMKIKQAFKEKKEKKKEKLEQEKNNFHKGKEGEQAYRSWLKDKIKEECAEYEKRKKELKEGKKKKKEEKLKQAEFKLKCDQAYQEWTEKVRLGRNCLSRNGSVGKRKLASEHESYYLSI